MIEKIKAVGNPLGIIGIFAALAEVAGTIALATMDKEIQQLFVWFVMGFPVLLVILFFLTLNFNPRVLYAPKDFRNEENFINLLVGTRTLSLSLDEAKEQLRLMREEILSEARSQIEDVGGAERARIVEVVNHRLHRIEATLDSARSTADIAASDVAAAFSESGLQAQILAVLRTEAEPKSTVYIAKRANAGFAASERALKELVGRGLVVEHETWSDPIYSLQPPTAYTGGLGGTI
jgi:hypothetical protein